MEENEVLKKEAEGGRQTRINISMTDGVFCAECVDDAGKKVSCEMALLDADGIAIMRWKLYCFFPKEGFKLREKVKKNVVPPLRQLVGYVILMMKGS